jgi:signal transduction histidine kinase
MRLAQFITGSSGTIIAEWEEFARTCVPAASGMDLEQRRDHIAGMLKAIALDLSTPQTTHEQAEKSKGREDAHGDTAANAHGSGRAGMGFTPVQMVAEFRALRASVLKLWSQTQSDFGPTDLDDVFRFNEAIDQALAESTARYAAEVDRSKDLLLGVIGHDLREPLEAILSAAATMTNDGRAAPHSEAAASILKSGQRMDGSLHALLDFTRSRLGGGIPVVPAPTNMAVLCQSTVDAFTALHPGRVVHFKATGALKGQWDSERIGQALCTLMAHADERGRADAGIDLSAHGEPMGVALTLDYKGPVIPRRELQDVFNPFQPSASPTEPGRTSGLGLYLAQAIVTAHHGTIHVASTDARTTFTVRLPRSPDGVSA